MNNDRKNFRPSFQKPAAGRREKRSKPATPRQKAVEQAAYYFSDENLIRDSFLRSQMSPDGWLPIDTLANFHRYVVDVVLM